MESQREVGKAVTRIRQLSRHLQQITEPTRRMLQQIDRFTEPTRRFTKHLEPLFRSINRLNQEPVEAETWWDAWALFSRSPEISDEARVRALERLVDQLPYLVHEKRSKLFHATLRREAELNGRTPRDELRARIASALPIAIQGLGQCEDDRQGAHRHHPGIGDLAPGAAPGKVLKVLAKTVARLVLDDLCLPHEVSRSEDPGGPLVETREDPGDASEPPDALERIAIIEALRELSERERQLCELNAAGRKDREIAAALEVTEGSVSTALSRVRKKVRSRL